jgi:3',5'-cyclic AMP phosphodiesterase CpdA
MMKKTILHFSDTHFGSPQAERRAYALIAEAERHRPAVVAISGDLTQRARSEQFRQARAFLDRVNAPLIVVPGNHDVPLWNVFARFFQPLNKYRRWVTPDLAPLYADDEIAVMGIDTTRSFTIKGGEVKGKALEIVHERMCELPRHVCKIVVAHHPFAPPPGFEEEEAVGGVEAALKLFDECGVEMVLTGHLHHSHVARSKDIYPETRNNILLVQAGTASSVRGRGSETALNSYNLITVTEREIEITSFVSDRSGAFAARNRWTARRGGG